MGLCQLGLPTLSLSTYQLNLCICLSQHVNYRLLKFRFIASTKTTSNVGPSTANTRQIISILLQNKQTCNKVQLDLTEIEKANLSKRWKGGDVKYQLNFHQECLQIKNIGFKDIVLISLTTPPVEIRNFTQLRQKILRQKSLSFRNIFAILISSQLEMLKR